MTRASPSGRVRIRICPQCDLEIAEAVSKCTQCGGKLVELRDEDDELIGTLIDERFEIRDLLGEGGMGRVYRAWQKSVGREVAIKLIDRSFARDSMAVRRFLREARLASQLSQPNTVSVFDFGQAADGRLFIAMELIRGRTLYAIRVADGVFPLARIVRVGVQICDALEAAHGLQIVHRDLKLENVVVLDHPPGRDLLKVLDFGLAKLVGEKSSRATESGVVVGTPRYMSPEVSMGATATTAADLYALGVILAELAIAGEIWGNDVNITALVAQKLDPEPVIARAPAPLQTLLRGLLAPEPDQRPTAAAARGQLTQITGFADAILVQLSDPGIATARTVATTPDLPLAIAQQPTRAITPRRSSEPSAPANPAMPIASTEHRPRRRGLAIALAAAVAIAAVVVFVVTRGPVEVVERAATPDAVVAKVLEDAAPVIADAPEPPPSPAKIMVRVTSKPAGAEIRVAGQLRGKAPLDVPLERGTAEIAIEARIGARAVTRSVVPDGDRALELIVPPPARVQPDKDRTPF